jgi:hypothetical protein
MTLTRSFDVDAVNRVVNHPDVRPYVGAPDGGPLDLAPLVERSEHWFLMDDHGGFLLAWSAPGVREVHTFIAPEGRGQWAASRRREMVAYAAANGAKMLWTRIPPKWKHVERFARQGGMRPTDDVIDTLGTPYRIFAMELVKCP